MTSELTFVCPEVDLVAPILGSSLNWKSPFHFKSDTTRTFPRLARVLDIKYIMQPKSYKIVKVAYVNRFAFLSLSILMSPFLIRW